MDSGQWIGNQRKEERKRRDDKTGKRQKQGEGKEDGREREVTGKGKGKGRNGTMEAEKGMGRRNESVEHGNTGRKVRERK